MSLKNTQNPGHQSGRNNLFPVFLKAETLNFVIIGGGKVAVEKLHFLLKSSPGTKVTVIAPDISGDIFQLSATVKNLKLIKRPFQIDDLKRADILLLATNDRKLNQSIREAARKRNILVNVADTPSLCDFYMGSIVTKGELKMAISTNGKSPTLAKRIREYLEESIPDSSDDILKNLAAIRRKLKGDLRKKMQILYKITANLVADYEGKN